MKINKMIVALALGIALVGCTDAERAALGTYGEENDVTCYSGGVAVFTDVSTGKVEASNSGAGVYFRSKTTGKYVRTYADCVVVTK